MVAVRERHGGVGRREAVRLHLAVARDRIVRGHERHVAVGALLRLGRVIEGARALARHARGLPVVVVVEAAEPAVVVHRHVEVHLVARRAEVRGLLAVERLQEHAPVRRRVELEQVVVGPGQDRVLAHRQVVQRRVLDLEVSLAHRAAHVHDRVARRAAEAVLRLGRVDLLLDRPVEAAVEEDGVVVAARAPLAGPGADRVLHVLDRLPVPLVVERREVVRRGVPLVVDVLVALGAGGARHEEVGGDDLAAVGVRGGGEERRARAGAFAVHAERRQRRVHDALSVRREVVGVVAQRRRERGRRERGERELARPGPLVEPVVSTCDGADEEQQGACGGERDVDPAAAGDTAGWFR